MANISGLQRKMVKANTEKMLGGNLVSDRETRQVKEQTQNIAEAGLQAQQAALARSQQAMAQAAPVQSGAISQTQGQLADAASNAAVKASGQAQDFAAALEEKRKAQTLRQGNEMVERAARRRQEWMQNIGMGVQAMGGLLGMGGMGTVASTVAGMTGNASQRAGKALINSGVTPTDEQIGETINFK